MYYHLRVKLRPSVYLKVQQEYCLILAPQVKGGKGGDGRPGRKIGPGLYFSMIDCGGFEDSEVNRRRQLGEELEQVEFTGGEVSAAIVIGSTLY